MLSDKLIFGVLFLSWFVSLLCPHSPHVNDIGADELFIEPWEERGVSSFLRWEVEPAHLS